MTVTPVGDVTGRKILIIAGARGIGLAMAGRFAELGAEVIFTARSAAAVEQATGELLTRSSSGVVHGVVLDVTEQSLEAKLSSLFESRGVPDAMIYNAGICPDYQRPEKISLANWDLVHETNLRGAIRASLVYGARCQAEGTPGSIVLISSMAGILAGEKLAPYVTAKTGMLGLARALALDWARVGIRVNVVAPGWVNTDLTSGLQANQWLNDKLISDIPMGYFAEPKEVVDVVVFLASESARYVTGSVYSVDGGLVAGE